MIYEIHLYAPKTGELVPQMMDWLFEFGQSDEQPESRWPVRAINPKTVARLLLKLDPSLKAVPGPAGDVELHHSDERLGIILYIHNRGVIVFFPYNAYGVLSRVVLGICYTYIRYLYEVGGFWSYDPQLNILSYADDYRSIEETAQLMDKIMPRLLP
ncbi:MAG: hypothetical protein EA396_05935 [Anaerolineaceae bacterium]|nr:MAG: hypothetical protein EA396_05935 [Anaerolineaceae bacterium]